MKGFSIPEYKNPTLENLWEGVLEKKGFVNSKGWQ